MTVNAVGEVGISNTERVEELFRRSGIQWEVNNPAECISQVREGIFGDVSITQVRVDEWGGQIFTHLVHEVDEKIEPRVLHLGEGTLSGEYGSVGLIDIMLSRAEMGADFSEL